MPPADEPHESGSGDSAGKPPRRSRAPRHGASGTERRRGKNLDRPVPAGAPQGLRRGTEAYREWEAEEVLKLRSAGVPPMKIREQLLLTRDEYLDRVRALTEKAALPERNLAWVEYETRSGRRFLDAERLLSEAIATKNTGAALAALRVLHDLDQDFAETVLLYLDGDGAPGSGAPSLVLNHYVLQVVQEVTGGADLRTLPPERLREELERVLREREALQDERPPPRFGPGGP